MLSGCVFEKELIMFTKDELDFLQCLAETEILESFIHLEIICNDCGCKWSEEHTEKDYIEFIKDNSFCVSCNADDLHIFTSAYQK